MHYQKVMTQINFKIFNWIIINLIIDCQIQYLIIYLFNWWSVILFFTWYAQNKPLKNTHIKQWYIYKTQQQKHFLHRKSETTTWFAPGWSKRPSSNQTYGKSITYIININEMNDLPDDLAISFFRYFGKISQNFTKLYQSQLENGHETNFIHITSNAST